MNTIINIQHILYFIFIYSYCSQGLTFPKDEASVNIPSSASTRNNTRWRFSTISNKVNTSQFLPLFPPSRSHRRHPIPKGHVNFNTDDSVFVNSHHDLGEDSSESDEMLLSEIQFLNESLTLLMQPGNPLHRRPSYNPDGTIQLFPTFNFAFLPDIGPLRQLFQWSSKSVSSYAVCHACRVGLGYLLLQARTKVSLADLSTKAIFICKFFNIATEDVCIGLVTRFGPTMHFILTTKVSISANTFCGIVLQAQGCASSNYLKDWSIELPPITQEYKIWKNSRPYSIIFNEDLATQSNTNSEKELKILHLTDIHLDLEYQPNGNADCDTELCCRQSDGIGDVNQSAGFYGDYRKCDLPLHSLVDALQHISHTHHDIDIIYMTGDLVPHNIWSTSVKENTEAIHVASNLIKQYFPNTPVFPVLGNHDVHPLNLFSPPGIPIEFSTEYIYTTALREWSDWIPRESYHTFLHAGFYAVEVTQYFKVIVLNTNLCYTLNFWQVYEHRDPGGQLRWLVKELFDSELANQKVHILGHVPPSLDECWATWSSNFYRIISRFSNTVTAQFYAHTHYDEFQLHYDPLDKSRAVSGIWIGASLTPFVNLNPGYKLFSIRNSDYNVLDHETWIYNLEEANSNPEVSPRWFRLYKATEAYGIPDLTPNSLNEFVHRMSSDSELFNKYYAFYHKASDASLKTECDKSCRKKILCRIVTPHHTEQKECILIQSEVDGVILPQQIFRNKTSDEG